MSKKVMAAMSGGVDSSVAAVLLLEQGYSVVGATLKLFSNEDIGECSLTKTCCSLEDVQDARRVAYKLGFEHFVFNFSEPFKAEVIERFAKAYQNGETPNPCIDCNRFIKFERMIERASLMEIDAIATGHYAIREFDKGSGRFLLKKAKDASKDQSYVLYSLTQHQLAHTLLPLGGLLKTEVRQIAEQHGLATAHKADSQDICFVPDSDYAGFLKNTMGVASPEGDFKDTEGNVIGRHKGIINYTIGQRKGLGVSFGTPRFVVSKDVKSNTVVLGGEGDLFCKRFVVRDVNLIATNKLHSSIKATVKTRYKQQEAPATLHPTDDGWMIVELCTGQRAVSPGQAAVFYDGDVVIGGGTIDCAH